jgi:hypothetical protein
MPDDQDTLASEILRLRKVKDRWRVVAIAALGLIFVGVLPITIAFLRVTQIRQARQIEYLLRENQKLEQQLRQTKSVQPNMVK